MKRKDGRKGYILLETVVAVVLIAVPLIGITIGIASQRPMIHYAQDKMTVASISYMKMQDICRGLENNPLYYKEGVYYGFQYAMGSSDDYSHDPSLTQYQKDPGTFYNYGFPEIRYQFYVKTDSSDSNLTDIYLHVWRRPKNKGGNIISIYLFDAVVKQ